MPTLQGPAALSDAVDAREFEPDACVVLDAPPAREAVDEAEAPAADPLVLALHVLKASALVDDLGPDAVLVEARAQQDVALAVDERVRREL